MTTPIASECVVVDSSGWLEYITNDTKAGLFARYIEGRRPILVPTIVIYEVRKILLLRHTKTLADLFVSDVLRRNVISIDEEIALAAAELSLRHHLAMADALLYAIAQRERAEFITSDPHFANLPYVTLL